MRTDRWVTSRGLNRAAAGLLLAGLLVAVCVWPTHASGGQPADAEPADAEPGDAEPADAEPADAEPADAEPRGLPNWKSGTLGGLQFWTDLHFRAGWRIQQHVYTRHCRLLDPAGKRHAWGNDAHCREKLDEVARREPLPEARGQVVVCVHGLGRTRYSMQPAAEYLEQHGYSVVNFSYASTRGNLDDHAEALRSVLEGLEASDSVSFVAHSLGNLVIRRCLATAEQDWIEQRRFRRWVMLAPPNQGAELARRLRQQPLFRHLLGQSAGQLAETHELEQLLATPRFDFGILAGRAAASALDNPLIAGEDDLVVGVEETRLAGARDFRVLPVVHTLMPQDEQVLSMTRCFLDHGYFEAEGQRQPLDPQPPAEVVPEAGQ